jgi:hypothetical protein
MPDWTEEECEAYALGRAAFIDKSKCPYKVGTNLWIKWAVGQLDAKAAEANED